MQMQGHHQYFQKQKAQQIARQAFNGADFDQSGSITINEFYPFIQNVFTLLQCRKNVTQMQCQNLFRYYDDDRNGHLTANQIIDLTWDTYTGQCMNDRVALQQMLEKILVIKYYNRMYGAFDQRNLYGHWGSTNPKGDWKNYRFNDYQLNTMRQFGYDFNYGRGNMGQTSMMNGNNLGGLGGNGMMGGNMMGGNQMGGNMMGGNQMGGMGMNVGINLGGGSMGINIGMGGNMINKKPGFGPNTGMTQSEQMRGFGMQQMGMGMNGGMGGMNNMGNRMNIGTGMGMNNMGTGMNGMGGMNTGMNGMNGMGGMNGMNGGMGGMNNMGGMNGMNGMNGGMGGMNTMGGMNGGMGGMNTMGGMNSMNGGMNTMGGMNGGMGGMNAMGGGMRNFHMLNPQAQNYQQQLFMDPFSWNTIPSYGNRQTQVNQIVLPSPSQLNQNEYMINLNTFSQMCAYLQPQQITAPTNFTILYMDEMKAIMLFKQLGQYMMQKGYGVTVDYRYMFLQLVNMAQEQY